jgi:CxxC motif-containing protein
MTQFAPALVGLCLLIIVGDNVKTAAAKTKDSDNKQFFVGIIKEVNLIETENTVKEGDWQASPTVPCGLWNPSRAICPVRRGGRAYGQFL